MQPSTKQHIDETFIDHLNLYEKRLLVGKSNVNQAKKRLNDAELAYNLYPNENEPAEVSKWNEKVHRILDDRDGNAMKFPNIQTIIEDKIQQALLKEQEEERKKLEWSLRYKYVAYNDGNKKTSKLSEKTLAGLREIRKNKRFGLCTFEFGPRLEGEELKVINNYQGVNSECVGRRTLIRKDAKFSTNTSSLPPWIGPGHYANYDPEYLKDRPDSSYQVTFKAVDRSVPPVGDIESLKLKESIIQNTVDFNKALEYEQKHSKSPTKSLLSPIKTMTSPTPKHTGLVKDYTYDALGSCRKVNVMDVPNIADYLDDQGRVVSDIFGVGKKGRNKAVKINFQVQNIEEAAEYLASLRATENAHASVSVDGNSVVSAGGVLVDPVKKTDDNGNQNVKKGKFAGIKSRYLDHPLLRKPPPLFEKPPLTEEEIAEKAVKKALAQEKAKASKAKYDELLSSVSFRDDIQDVITNWYRDNRIVYQKPKNLSKLNDHKSIPVIAIRDFIIRESCPADTTEEDEIKLYMSRQHELDDEALTDEIKDYLNKQKRNNDEIPSADVDDDDVSIC